MPDLTPKEKKKMSKIIFKDEIDTLDRVTIEARLEKESSMEDPYFALTLEFYESFNTAMVSSIRLNNIELVDIDEIIILFQEIKEKLESHS